MTKRSWPLPALLILAGSIAAAQRSDFSVSIEEVRVDVLATENAKPVEGLTAADFEILDNGVAQEIQYAVLLQQEPVNAILIFDMSRSVAGSMLSYLKNAASSFLAGLSADDHAALITFNNAVVLGSPPTRDHGRIMRALDRAEPHGNSSLIDAVYTGMILAQSRSDPGLIVIFSDGRDTMSWLPGGPVLETAKRNEVVVYAVSSEWILNRPIVSAESPFASRYRMPEKTFLGDLADLTGGSLMNLESMSDLAAAFHSVLVEFRQRYLLTYTPRGVPENGWHEIEVRAKNRSVKVKSRPGYRRN